MIDSFACLGSGFQVPSVECLRFDEGRKLVRQEISGCYMDYSYFSSHFHALCFETIDCPDYLTAPLLMDLTMRLIFYF